MVELYLAVRFIVGEEDMDLSHMSRLAVTALVIVLIVPILSSIMARVGIPELGAVLAFVIMSFVIKHIVVSPIAATDEMEHSVLVAFMSLLFIYIFNAVTLFIFDTTFVTF